MGNRSLLAIISQKSLCLEIGKKKRKKKKKKKTEIKEYQNSGVQKNQTNQEYDTEGI